MSELAKGDYVVATKYPDGDPGDHWFVGYYVRKEDGRHYVVDANGVNGRGNGFRRAEKIEAEDGAWLLSNAVAWEGDRRVKSVWDYLSERRLVRELAASKVYAQGLLEERDAAQRDIAAICNHHCESEGCALPDGYTKGAAAYADRFQAMKQKLNAKLPCKVSCEGGPSFGKGVGVDALLGYLERRVGYNEQPPFKPTMTLEDIRNTMDSGPAEPAQLSSASSQDHAATGAAAGAIDQTSPLNKGLGASVAASTIPPGPCGAMAQSPFRGGVPLYCHLRAGHAGMHETNTGSAFRETDAFEAGKLSAPIAVVPKGLVSQGRCETTLTERFRFDGCKCGTYEGNLGPCLTWCQGGASNRCVYCDHNIECHCAISAMLAAAPAPNVPEGWKAVERLCAAVRAAVVRGEIDTRSAIGDANLLAEAALKYAAAPAPQEDGIVGWKDTKTGDTGRLCTTCGTELGNVEGGLSAKRYVSALFSGPRVALMREEDPATWEWHEYDYVTRSWRFDAAPSTGAAAATTLDTAPSQEGAGVAVAAPTPSRWKRPPRDSLVDALSLLASGMVIMAAEAIKDAMAALPPEGEVNIIGMEEAAKLARRMNVELRDGDASKWLGDAPIAVEELRERQLAAVRAGSVLVCRDRDGQCPTPEKCLTEVCQYTGAASAERGDPR